MKARLQRTSGALSVFVPLGLAVSLPASAEAVNAEQRARAAFEAGRTLAAAGDYSEACAQFEKSLRLVDAMGTAYNLADCEEHRGHFARAQALFTHVADRSHELGQSEREQLARERAGALDQRLSFLTIELATPSVTLSLDGRALSREAIESPIAIDPGKHRLSAVEKGKRGWSTELEIPRAQLLLPVSVPALEALSSEAAKPAPRPPRERARPGLPVRRAVPNTGLALALGGVGLAAVGTGAFFGWRYLSKNSDAKDTCPSSFSCPAAEIAAHQELVDEARAARNLSYIGFGVGAAALAGAAVVLLATGGEHAVAAGAQTANGGFLATVAGKF
jgi:tetratricopeptide (TPR) repeat protein